MSLIKWTEVAGVEGQKCRTLAKHGGQLHEKLGEYAALCKKQENGAGIVKATLKAEDGYARNQGCEPYMPMKALTLYHASKLGLGVIETLSFAQAKPLFKLFHVSPTGLNAGWAKAAVDVCGSEAAVRDAAKDLVAKIKAEEIVGDAIRDEVKKLIGEGAAMTFWEQAAHKLNGKNGQAHLADLMNSLGAAAAAEIGATLESMASEKLQAEAAVLESMIEEVEVVQELITA